MAYERKVKARIEGLVEEGLLEGEVHSGQWIQFWDAAGSGWAQPDIYIVQQAEGRIVLLECKLTQTGRAWPQMRRLYKPLLEYIYGLPVVCVQVCRNLRFDPGPGPGELIEDLSELERSSHTWHLLA